MPANKEKEEMNIDRKVSTMVAGFMVPVLIVGFCPVSMCLSADTISEIQSITPAESAARVVDIRAKDYFDIIGTLNLIDGRRIVIGNTTLQLSGGANTSGVSLYDKVGARLNEKGEVSEIKIISDFPH
jgi:hypothetical protein